MGCRNREIFTEEDSTRPSSLSEALLFATMCLIGMNVDVHVKDGSVYSGIFHTASGEKDYGIVLKKARMTQKGKNDTNVAKAGIIETLVILSCDLVQVVAKGALFPTDGVVGNMAGDDMEAIDTSAPYSDSSMSECERSTPALTESVHVTHKRKKKKEVVQTRRSFCPPFVLQSEMRKVYILESGLAQRSVEVALSYLLSMRKSGKEDVHTLGIADFIMLIGNDSRLDWQLQMPESSQPTENGFLPVSSSMIVDNKHKKMQPKSLQIGKHIEVENGKLNETNLANMKIGEVSRALLSKRQAGDDTLIAQNDECIHMFESSEVNNSSKAREDDATYAVTASIPKGELIENGHPNMIAKFPVNEACNGNLPAPPKPNVGSHERFTLAGSASTDTIIINVSSLNQAANGGPDSSQESPAKFNSGNSKSNMGGKEFKLNPGAKIFSPSLTHPISAAHSRPSVASIAYVPNSSHVMTVPAAQQEVGFSPYRPSLVKFSQYGSMTAGNGGSASQFSNPVVGHVAHRAQAVRYAGNYNPVLADPAYLHPTSPAVMVGRLGQFVYMHPVPTDMVQDAAAIAPASARPLLTPNHVQITKQHGLVGQSMQYCVPPAAITSGLQPFPMSSQIPVLQPPFPPGRPIPVPGSNGFYGTKL